MDAATLILIPLVSGYYFASKWDGSRYRLAREQGQRLYFKSALYGIILLALSVLLYFAYHQISCLPKAQWLIPIYQKYGISNPLHHTYFETATITLLLSVSLSYLLNLLPNSQIYFYEAAIRDADFEQLVWDSIQEEFPISITMANGKVYIGYVVRAIDPAKQRTHLRILPILSGFRDDIGGVGFTNNYAAIYEKLNDDSQDLSHLDLENFEMVLPYNQIQSANFFDAEAYIEFNSIDGEASKEVDAL